MTISRRAFLHQGGVGLLAFTIAGCQQEMTPEAARKIDVPMQVLSAAEVSAIEALGEALLPGSAERGLAHYIDHQLNAPQHENMLMIRYLGVPPPFTPFYQAGLAASATASTNLFSSELQDLDDSRSRELIGKMAAGDVGDWQGPPAAFFYFVLRADAVDVVYGTQRGFEELGIPYAAHIEPPSRWGE